MRGIVVAVVVLAAVPAFGQQGQPSDEQIRQAIKDLGAEKFAVRQRAAKLLMSAGDAAEKPLREAARGRDPEVVRQARLLLDRILYRVDPDTPQAVVDLMTRFRQAEGSATEQATAVREMLRHGSRGHKFLVRLLDAVDDKTRQVILDQFAYDDWKVLGSLVADGHEPLVDELLDKAMAAQLDSAIPHYAGFQMLNGRLDAKVKEARARAEQSGQVFDARVLYALCRLADDREGTLWAARRCEDPLRVDRQLAEMGRWSELLAGLSPPRSGLIEVTDLGYRGAYQRLAGRDADFKQTVAKIEEYGNKPDGRRNRPWYAAKVLLINERPAEALALLRKQGQNEVLVEFLVSQARLREALELSEASAKEESGRGYTSRAAHIDLLLRAGLSAKAREWLTKLSADMGESTEPGWLDRLSAFEVRLGDRAAAEKRLLARLERNDGSSLGPTFTALYPRLDWRAEALLTMLRQQQPNVDLSRQVEKLHQIDEGKFPAGELTELLRSSYPVNRHTSQPRFDVVAQLVAGLQQPDAAAALLVDPTWEAAPADVRLSLGDTLAEAGRWPAAANAYRRAWEQDKGLALPLFLYAQALLKANPNDAKAKDLVERSHRVPLGGDWARYHFHLALAERGYGEDAFREAGICVRLAGPNMGLVLDRLASQLAQRGESEAAAAILERNVLRWLPIGNSPHLATTYSRLAGEVHFLRARAHLAGGRKAEAFREVDAAEAQYPANLSPAIRLVPALENAGEKERAEQLFERVAGHWRKACEEFPDCALAHNQIAWLCARCRRNLDEALTHARKAVELAPQEPAYKDTLAEVLFQRGDRQSAVEQINACIKLAPSNAGFYRRQLMRFRTGQPSDEPAED
jgi:tetratricopeptide (TPR) repeat protein